MRKTLMIAALLVAPGMAVADDTKPVGNNGHTIGPDGKMWRMEGCAAYPVEPQAGAQSKPVTAAVTKAEEKPAKLARSEKPAE